MMSSLQQHASLMAPPPPQPSKQPTPCTNNDASSATKKNNAKHSFESCFSAGLDLSEFATTNSSNNSNNIIVAASAGLAQQKRNAVEQQTREDKAEIVLEQRVANVIDATTKQHDSATTNNSIHDQLGNVIPRAINPHNEKSTNVDNSWDHHMNNSSSIDDEIIKGRSRDDNFVQFQDSHGAGNEFLSCLVSNHKVEGEEGRIGSSHRARMTKKKQQQLLQKKKMSPGTTGRQHHTIASKKMSPASGGSGRKVFAKKKSRKSKY